MTHFIRALFCISVSCFSLSVIAFEINTEFSAEAVQSMPGRTPVTAKMFISKNAVRTESTINGKAFVEIVFPHKKQRLLLNQLKKTYFEQTMPADNSAKKFKANMTPCDALQNATCKNLGNEKINGRNSIKWEMTATHNNQTRKSLHWLDTKYHIPVREQYPDGTITTMTFAGKEKMNGRKTEKWKFHATRSNGQQTESLQWYDLKLKMVIREELPGGYVRELRNIKIATQNKNLFKVPSGYKKEMMHGTPRDNRR